MKKTNKQKKLTNINTNTNTYPMVSVCTPTFNRRPFIPYMLKCFEHQTYPKDKIEWIIVDDGTDKIGDILTGPCKAQIKYFSLSEKLTLGKKRNYMHSKCSGDIIVYMDDDDYYPPDRITHAVETLQKNPQALCAGSSIMYIYFKHISKMYQFGPYGPNHATAATFAFRKELLKQTSYEEAACLAEEKHFLKNYTIPFVQLDPKKTILVLSHVHNSFDKKDLLKQGENQYMRSVNIQVSDFIKDKDTYTFYMKDIDNFLNIYEPGNPKNKPDVLKQMEKMKCDREKMMVEHQKQQLQQNNMNVLAEELKLENNALKSKVQYLENKITQLIQQLIEAKQENKKMVQTVSVSS